MAELNTSSRFDYRAVLLGDGRIRFIDPNLAGVHENGEVVYVVTHDGDMIYDDEVAYYLSDGEDIEYAVSVALGEEE